MNTLTTKEVAIYKRIPFNAELISFINRTFQVIENVKGMSFLFPQMLIDIRIS